jgi:hypothetical protein
MDGSMHDNFWVGLHNLVLSIWSQGGTPVDRTNRIVETYRRLEQPAKEEALAELGIAVMELQAIHAMIRVAAHQDA